MTDREVAMPPELVDAAMQGAYAATREALGEALGLTAAPTPPRRSPPKTSPRATEEPAPLPDREPFFHGLYQGRTPIYACPQARCHYRGRRSEDVMWHLGEAHPDSQGGN